MVFLRDFDKKILKGNFSTFRNYPSFKIGLLTATPT